MDQIERIQRFVGSHYRVSRLDILSSRRDAAVVRAGEATAKKINPAV